MVSGALSRSNESRDGVNDIGRQGDRIIVIRVFGPRRFPAMGLENMINVGFTGQLDVVMSLMDIDAIIVNANALGIEDPDTFKFGGYMLVDDSNELFSSLGGLGGDSKVINLVTDKNKFTINFAMIKVPFMSGGGEVEFIALKNANNHPFPESTSFRVTLESMVQRDDMCVRVNVSAKVLAMPRMVGIIDLKVALLSQWWQLLEGILGVGNGHSKTFGSGNGEEHAHAWLFNARGICLSKLMQPGGSTL